MIIVYFLLISVGIFFVLLSPYFIYIDFRKRAAADRYECQHCHHRYGSSVLRTSGYKISGSTQVKCPSCGQWTQVIELKKNN